MVTGAGVEVAGGESAAAVGSGAEALGLAEEDEEGSVSSRLVNEAAGPPFSHSLLFGPAFGLAGPSLSAMALPAPLASETARRASRRRVFSVSRLKWTLLKSLASLAAAAVAAASASLLVSLFHFAEAPGAGGAGGG